MYDFTPSQARALIHVLESDADCAAPLRRQCVAEQRLTMRELERRADRVTDERVFEQLRRDMGDDDCNE